MALATFTLRVCLLFALSISVLSAAEVSDDLFDILDGNSADDEVATEVKVATSVDPVSRDSIVGSKIKDPQVRACAEKGLPEFSLSQMQDVDVVGKTGFVRKSTREVFWKRFENKRSKAVVRVVAPQQEVGVAVLYLETERVHANWYMYQKEFKRPRRVTGSGISGSVLGTDFSYEDFEHIEEIIYTGEVTRMPDVEIGGHMFYVIERQPENNSSQYSLVKGFIDQVLCVPMRTEFYDHSKQLKKALIVNRLAVKRMKDRWIPYESTMFDYSRKTHTVFTNYDIKIDIELHNSMFTPQFLKRGR
jgi:hypothetical protein